MHTVRVVGALLEGGGGFGVMPLDDAFRAHGWMANRAAATRLPREV
eukprot:gene23446-9543_t